MTDDTGILQHAVFTVPRYDDGYCLDDNARALLLMTLLEDAGTEDAAVVRALASRYLAFVSHAFDARARPLPQLHVVLAALDRGVRLGGQPRPRAVGARHRRRPLAAIRAGRASAATCSTPRCRRSSTFTSPRAWAFALLGIDEYLRAFQRRQRRPGGAQARSPSASSTCTSARARPTGRGSRTASPTATPACRRRSSCRGARMEHEEMTRCRPAIARLARLGPAARRATATSRRSDRTVSTGAARDRRASISSRSRRARWSRRVSKRIGSPATDAGSSDARRAFNWFLGAEPAAAAALRRLDAAAAATGCTPIASTRTRARNRRCRFCSRSPRCARRIAPTRHEHRQGDHDMSHMGKTRGYETLFQRHAANPILTAADWPYPGAHASSTPAPRASPTARRCCSAASRIAAATRTCARRARRTASTAGSIDESRRCGPIPSTIRRSCGASRIRASPSSTSSAST